MPPKYTVREVLSDDGELLSKNVFDVAFRFRDSCGGDFATPAGGISRGDVFSGTASMSSRARVYLQKSFSVLQVGAPGFSLLQNFWGTSA